jgi:plasmid stability protein
MANVTLRNFDDKLYRELKAEAARDGLTVVEALAQAVSVWLTVHTHKKNRKSVFDYKAVDFGPGSEKSSQEIDTALYGKEG